MKNLIVASRYATSLYAEAKDAGMIEQLANDLNGLDALLNTSSDFLTLVHTTALHMEEKLSVVDALGNSGKISRLLYAFLVVLIKNRRLAILPAVIEAVRKQIHSGRNEIEADVSYAEEVDDSIRAALVRQLTQLTGKDIILNESIDPSLLGGLKVVIGSTLYDASIRGRLDALKVQLSRQ